MTVIAIYHPLINDENRYFEFIATDNEKVYLCNKNFEILDAQNTFGELKEIHDLDLTHLTEIK